MQVARRVRLALEFERETQKNFASQCAFEQQRRGASAESRLGSWFLVRAAYPLAPSHAARGPRAA